MPTHMWKVPSPCATNWERESEGRCVACNLQGCPSNAWKGVAGLVNIDRPHTQKTLYQYIFNFSRDNARDQNPGGPCRTPTVSSKCTRVSSLAVSKLQADQGALLMGVAARTLGAPCTALPMLHQQHMEVIPAVMGTTLAGSCWQATMRKDRGHGGSLAPDVRRHSVVQVAVRIISRCLCGHPAKGARDAPHMCVDGELLTLKAEHENARYGLLANALEPAHQTLPVHMP